MMRTALTGLALLVGMQVFGQTVVWDALWSNVRTFGDTRLATYAWWTWTAIQIGAAVAVGFAMGRAGLRLARAARVREGGALCERCGIEIGLIDAVAA
jgi:hypothetical protein